MTFAQHALTDASSLEVVSLEAVRVAREPKPATPALSDKLVGLLLVSLLPSLFWMLALAGIGYLFGSPFAQQTLFAFGAAVAAFLGIIYSALSPAHAAGRLARLRSR